MKKVITVLAIVFSLLSQAQTSWVVDPSHSKVNFSVSHLIISEVDGTFKEFGGDITSNSDDFSNADIQFKIDVNSINTDNAQRDAHLKSEDFFHVEKYPEITFKSTSFKKKKDNIYILKGNLTLRGVTKKVTLNVKHGGIAKDGYGNTKAGFIITGDINRIDYGVAWNAKTEHGGLTVGEKVNLVVKLEFVKK